jgi:DNA-binding transcriptional regulator GbsR (MarR family)
MGLKELGSWQLVQVQHKPGERREFYHTRGSIWDMANRVFEERRKREMDPTLSLLRDIMMDEAENAQEVYAQQRIAEMHDLLENITEWTQSLQSLSPEKLNTLMKLGSGVGKVLEFTETLRGKKDAPKQA